MRVLHVIPSIAAVHGGPSCALQLMERGLSAAGVDVTTVTTDDDGRGRRLQAIALATEMHGAKRLYFRKWFDFYKFAPSILPWLFRHLQRFDVVHIHALFSFTSVAAALMADRRGIFHTSSVRWAHCAERITQRRPRLKKMSLAILEGPILRPGGSSPFHVRG